MKRSLVTRLVLLVLCVTFVQRMQAQDAQLFAERDIMGTARYVGMAGAMSSVGADPSAVLDNPAGLGLYRRIEVSLTMQQELNYSQAYGNRRQLASQFALPQASLVFAFENRKAYSPLKFCNFMFSFNRTKSYNHTMAGNMLNQHSIANLMLDQTVERDGRILDERTMSEFGYNSPAVGWLSRLGYMTYMIDPVYDADSVQIGWSTPYTRTLPRTALKVDESGYMDEYTLNWAGNFNHHWHLGVGLTIHSLYYSKRTVYEEELSSLYAQDLAQISSYVRQTGVGVSGTIGVIYQPWRFWRIGFALQTPRVMKVSTTSSADMALTDTSLDYRKKESTLQFIGSDRMNQPLRTSLGMTFLCKDKGLVSLQYDYRHSRNIRDVHTLKLGLEVVPVRNLFLNAGYACEASWGSSDVLYTLAQNDVRTDAEFSTRGIRHIAGIGIGYRGNHVVAHLAYQYANREYHTHPFVTSTPQTTPAYYLMRDNLHRIVFTFAWHTRN